MLMWQSGYLTSNHFPDLNKQRFWIMNIRILNKHLINNKVSYIPVEGHTVELRELISAEEAKALKLKIDDNTSQLLIDEIKCVLKDSLST